MGENVTDEIDKEVNLLQNKLKQTLKEEEERGENIQSLDNRVENLQERAGMFRTDAHDARNKLWWRNFKWMAIAAAVALVLGLILYKALQS